MPRVFISYTHDTPDHKATALTLSNRLRAGDVDCMIDQYIESPRRGWPNWCLEQIEESQFVLVVCTDAYLRRLTGKEAPGVGRGGIWEGFVMTQEIYNSQASNDKFIPILFSESHANSIPVFLAGVTRYDLSQQDGFERLYRRLTDQPWITMPPLGERQNLPSRDSLDQAGQIPTIENRAAKTASLINLPFARNPFFTGREELLNRIHRTLQATGAAAISGMAGQGKTQTALEYAYRHKDDYSSTLWARANSREAIVSSLASLARALRLPEGAAAEQTVAVGAVKAWLESRSRWLLILDNADEIDLVREFIPSVGNSCILITTVVSSTGAVAERVPIEDMLTDEGALLLLRRMNRISRTGHLQDASEEERKYARLISAELGGLPLALDQAAAFVEETYYSLRDYLQLYRREGAKLRANTTASVGECAPISVTFSIAFKKTAQANERAAALIQLSSFLAPSAIPERIFIEGAPEIGEKFASYSDQEFEFSQIIKHAVRLSLMQRNADRRTLSIHRLVQAALRDTLADNERKEWAERALRLIHRAVATSDFEDPSRWEGLLPHVQACADLIAEYGLDSAESAALLARTAKYCFTRALLAEAEAFSAQGLKIREKVFGPFSLPVAESLDDLGLINDFECKFPEAETRFRRALQIHSDAAEKDELALATLLNDMANSYFAQSRYAEAESLYKQSLEIRERLLPLDSRDHATSLYNLARLYETRGDYREAEQLYQQSLNIREKVLGPEHRDVAISLSNLANLRALENQEDKAFQLYERALRIREKNFGRKHPDVAASLNSLANLHFQRYHDDIAEAYYREAIAIWEEKVGKNHPATATGLANLGNLLKARGKHAEAEQLYRRALDICERSLGPNSLKTAVNLEYVGNLLVDLHRASEAEPLFVRAREIREQSLGPKHLGLAANINNLAGAYYDRGEFDKAEPLYKNALDIEQELLGPDHLDVALTLNNLAGVYFALGRYHDAETTHRRALAIRQKHRGDQHPHVALSMSNLAAALAAEAKYAEAETLAKRALDLRRKAAKPDDSEIAQSLNVLGRVYFGMGKYAEAEQVFSEVLSMPAQCLSDPVVVAEALNDLGQVYVQQRRFRQAEESLTKALQLREQNLGKQHPDTAAAAQALAQLHSLESA